MNRLHGSISRTRIALACLALCLSNGLGHACTTAVVSGRATVDGRPLLWKNRDTRSSRHNEVVAIEGGRFRAIAVVNAGKRKSVWMGVNEAGFCIENSLSKDLRTAEKHSGPGNGGLMRMALERCETVADFRELLRETAGKRVTVANFGVIDAEGGASLFETGPETHLEFNANDPKIAPDGYIVRSNFSTVGSCEQTSATPDPAATDDLYSADRYRCALRILQRRDDDGLSLDEMLTYCTRDLSQDDETPLAGSVNGPAGALPETLSTANTISRTTTVSAAVFHGVRPGEDPRLTTMWTLLGDPKFSIAVPVFATGEVADELAGQRGGEIGEIALTLRESNLTPDRNGVRGANLPGIWNDLIAVESKIVARTLDVKERWLEEGFTATAVTKLQGFAAAWAMRAMEKELAQAKQNALATPTPSPATFSLAATTPTVRVAVYDHSGGTAGGPKNLKRILRPDDGFAVEIVTPQQIREGVLAEHDVLIMPGGSGSSQSKRLEESGRQAIKDYVDAGGGYVGVCAGSYLASSQYDWSLHLINARVWDRVHWARGTGMVRLALAPSAGGVLGTDAPELDVYYGQGPLLVPGGKPNLPGYEVLASYATGVAKKGAPENAMPDTHAIVRARYGAGRVICFSPHPEKPSGPESIMAEGVRWAGRGARPAAR